MLLRGRLSTLGGYTIPIALAHGAQWLLDFEQQLLSDPAIDRADPQLVEMDDAITFMMRAVFEAVRSETAEEAQDPSRAA